MIRQRVALSSTSTKECNAQLHTHKKISSPGCSPTIQGRAIYNAFPGTYATVRGASHVRIYPYQCIPVAPKYGVPPRRSVDRLRAGNAVK